MTPEILETIAAREVDEVLRLAEADGLRQYVDAHTMKLIRAVMICSFERGAGYMAEQVFKLKFMLE